MSPELQLEYKGYVIAPVPGAVVIRDVLGDFSMYFDDLEDAIIWINGATKDQ